LANQRIGPIAYRWGFKNVSAFSQLFQKAYGVTPRQARLAGSSGMIGLATSSSEGEAGVLAEWLRQTAKT
jgi:AraC-like DNA-binding protein